MKQKSGELKTQSGRKLQLTENQWKVIRDKYLRDIPTPEEWLWGIAHNAALAEVLVHPKAGEWGVYNRVHYTIHSSKSMGGRVGQSSIRARTGPSPNDRQDSRRVDTGTGAGAPGVSSSARYLGGASPLSGSGRMVLFHENLHECSDRDRNIARLLANLEEVYKSDTELRAFVEPWEKKFFELLASFDFLPNSPTLMNAGRELQQLSACYVLPVPDSMEGISASLAAQSLIQKSGGGTGFSFGRLRPKGDPVKKTRGVASGAISFMQLFDKMTDVVKQGGTRRGANMGILPYWHPEIKDFITMKCQPGVMENFNVSVGIDEEFMGAVQTDAEIELRNPRTGEATGKARAKELFDLMVECAWKTGDPGYVVLDRINNSGSNPTPALGQIESTNPCGEQPLLPWEPCNLGSINLSNFVEGPLGEGVFNFERLGETVDVCIRLLDNIIEVNNYPLPEIEWIAKGNRRIGLGVMGWAECLVKLGIAYDSQAALDFAEKLMGFLNDRAMVASEDLGRERGVFPFWQDSIYDPESKHYRGDTRYPRNCARTTIAPTGTIAIAAGLQGGGIEPFFGIAYTRYNAKALDALKKGESPDLKDVFFEVNPLFKEVAKKNNFFGLTEEKLFKKIDQNHKSVRGIAEIPSAVQRLFLTAHNIDWETHIRIQSAFQKHTDNGVSKTINMPNAAKVEDIRRTYLLAYKLGCKGITVYRDGCKSQQVLNLTTGGPAKPKKKVRRERPFGVKSEYFNVKTGYGSLHVHINYDDQGPYQLFTNLPPLGTEISGLTSLIGILVSKYLEAGGDPIRILKHLNAVKGDRPIGFGENKVNSIAHGIALTLRDHLKRTGWISSQTVEEERAKLELWEATQTLYCPSCYSSNVQYESGCSGPTCHDCGYSECG